jgi:molybdopterin adenylyltransferase
MDMRVNVILFSHSCGSSAALFYFSTSGGPYNRIMTDAAVITVSDSSSQGQRVDLSGPAVAAELTTQGFDVKLRLLVADDQKAIEDALRTAANEVRLVVTTGGTGISARDVTPEATRAVCSRLLDGIPELIRAEGRKETPMAALSRALCGTVSVKRAPGSVKGSPESAHSAEIGESLVLNLPGSPRGAVTSLRIALPLLRHALALLAGNVEHDAGLESTGGAH